MACHGRGAGAGSWHGMRVQVHGMSWAGCGCRVMACHGQGAGAGSWHGMRLQVHGTAWAGCGCRVMARHAGAGSWHVMRVEGHGTSCGWRVMLWVSVQADACTGLKPHRGSADDPHLRLCQLHDALNADRGVSPVYLPVIIVPHLLPAQLPLYYAHCVGKATSLRCQLLRPGRERALTHPLREWNHRPTHY